MKRFEGYISWYDASGDDGILYDFKGNDFYFNGFSFPGTHYKVTGKCKKTGKKKTIKTKHFPGLFLERELVKDRLCNSELLSGMPVTFTQAKGIDQRWAVKVRINRSKAARVRVIDFKIKRVKKAINDNYGDFLVSERTFKIWEKHYLKQLERLVQKRKQLTGKAA